MIHCYNGKTVSLCGKLAEKIWTSGEEIFSGFKFVNHMRRYPTEKYCATCKEKFLHGESKNADRSHCRKFF